MELHELQTQNVVEWVNARLDEDDLLSGRIPAFRVTLGQGKDSGGLTELWPRTEDTSIEVTAGDFLMLGDLDAVLHAVQYRERALAQIGHAGRAILETASKNTPIYMSDPVRGIFGAFSGLSKEYGSLERFIMNPEHKEEVPELGQGLMAYSYAIPRDTVAIVHGGRAYYLLVNYSDVGPFTKPTLRTIDLVPMVFVRRIDAVPRITWVTEPQSPER
jgi:hypothetical protein